MAVFKKRKGVESLKVFKGSRFQPWTILVPRSLSQPFPRSFCHVSAPEKPECPWINEWMITLFTAISRKNVHATIPKGNMGYNQYTVPWHCSFQTYFRCFPLALADIRPWPLMPFVQISLKNGELKTTHNTLRDCRVHFCDNLSLFLEIAVYTV